MLLASGVRVTWAHHRLIEGKYTEGGQSLLVTVGLGAYFTLLQGGEYILAPFSLADRVYGSVFFVATGFHGLHVIIGRIFLMVSLVRIFNYHYSIFHHLGFEIAA